MSDINKTSHLFDSLFKEQISLRNENETPNFLDNDISQLGEKMYKDNSNTHLEQLDSLKNKAQQMIKQALSDEEQS